MTKKEQSSMPERGTLAEANPAAANPLREAKELELKQRQERFRKEQAKLLADLWDAGFRVESVWDFVNTRQISSRNTDSASTRHSAL